MTSLCAGKAFTFFCAMLLAFNIFCSSLVCRLFQGIWDFITICIDFDLTHMVGR
jgi:hypothetical protein